MAPGEAGAALTGASNTAGAVVTAGQNGDWGDMSTAITNTAGATTAGAGYENIGGEITDWGKVAG